MTVQKVVEAVMDCAKGLIGSVRVVGAGDLLAGAYAEASDFQLAQRVRINPRVEVEVVGSERTGGVGPVTSDRAILAVDLRIALAMTTETEVSEAARTGVRNDALAMWEEVRRALTWPGNLATTSAGSATGIVSGCLTKCGPMRVTREDWPKRIYRMEAPARALVLDNQAVS